MTASSLVCECRRPQPRPVPYFGGYECARCRRAVIHPSTGRVVRS